MNHRYQKNISGCGLTGVISRKGELIPGEIIMNSICPMRDRGNGLGAGFAGYGIYPEYKDYYAFHLMYDDEDGKRETEIFLHENYNIVKEEEIPHKKIKSMASHPILYRYFANPNRENPNKDLAQLEDDDFVVRTVMKINSEVQGAYVFSSGKNMGAFKGVGFPEEIADFFMIDSYKGYIWTAHNRFPTNTPGWWGGAHPFTLLDWSIVHNGEISSYGINKRYLEMFGYKCSLLTDTEVIAYLFDLLIRKHGLSFKTACTALAAPFWKDIDILPDEERKVLTWIRMVYGSGLLNGPFATLFGHSRGLIGFNDRIKLRPLVVAEKDDRVYMASEESAIREICPTPDRVWAPKAGEPVIVYLDKSVKC